MQWQRIMHGFDEQQQQRTEQTQQRPMERCWHLRAEQHMAVIALMRGLVNLNGIMGMDASQIADRGDPAGARISRTPAAEHPATRGRDRHAGVSDPNQDHEHECVADRGSR